MHQVNPNDNRASLSTEITSYVFPFFADFDHFQYGGQTANFRAKDYKDIVERPYSYLCTKSIQMIIGLAEAEKLPVLCFVPFLPICHFQDGGQTVNIRAKDYKDLLKEPTFS